MDRHEFDPPACVFRRALTRTRRTAVALGLAAALAGSVTLAGAGGALAQVPPCSEYVTVFQTTSDGNFTGPGTSTLSPGEFSIDNNDLPHRFVAMAGVTRPRRSATFRYVNQDNVVVNQFTTTPSGDNGVINQQPNVLAYDFTQPGQRIKVYADFHTRCGGDDVLASNVFVGTILTLPSPVVVSPRYLVLSVAYAPPGAQSSVGYGSSQTLASKLSFSQSLQFGITEGNTLSLNQQFDIGSSTTFNQKAQDSVSVTVEKTTTNDIIIPGPKNSQNGIDHGEDIVSVWLNPQFTVTATSGTSLVSNGFGVDGLDPVSPQMDVVRLSVNELKDPNLIPAGDASRLQRSWSLTGALTIDDFSAILAQDPFASGSDTFDPARFELVPGGTFDYSPADPGGQPITQKFSVKFQAASTQSASLTSEIKFDISGPNESVNFFNNTLTQKHQINRTLDFTQMVTLDQTSTANQTVTVSLTGPTSGYQGQTAGLILQDNVTGSLMFAFAKVATFEIGAPSPNQTVTQGGSAAFPITTQSDFGFSGNVNFDPNVMGLPAGAQASFSPASVPVGSGTTLTVTTTRQTPAGSYPLTITASSGLIKRHLTVNLVVNPLPFTLSATPSSQTVSSGQSATYTVTVKPAGGFSGPVQLSGPAGLPPGATASYNPTTINGSGSSTLTVTTSGSTPTGTSALTVTGTGGSITQTATVSLVVDNTQDFDLTVTPQAAGIFAGDTAAYTVTTTAINGFSGNVDLIVGGQPAGATPSFSVNPIAGAGSSDLSIATTTSTPPGNYQLTITGTSGGLSHSQTVGLTVSPPRPDFTLAVTPGTASAPPGGSTTYSVSTGAIGGFTGGIELKATGLPTGVTASFDVTPVSPGSGATLTVSVDPSTPPGDYPLTITGTSGSLTHSDPITLTVT